MTSALSHANRLRPSLDLVIVSVRSVDRLATLVEDSGRCRVGEVWTNSYTYDAPIESGRPAPQGIKHWLRRSTTDHDQRISGDCKLSGGSGSSGGVVSVLLSGGDPRAARASRRSVRAPSSLVFVSGSMDVERLPSNVSIY